MRPPHRASICRSLAVIVTALCWCGNTALAQTPDLRQALEGLRAGQRPSPSAGDRNAWECVVSGSQNGHDLGSVKVEVQRIGQTFLTKQKKLVVCRNDGAVFAVEKSKDGKSWVLLKYVRSDLDGVWQRQMGHDRPIYSPLQALNELWDTLSMLDDPEFNPLRAWVVAGGRVEIDYTYKLPANDKGSRTPVTGTLTLAPDLDWVVVKSTCRAEQGPQDYPIVGVLTRDAERVDGVVSVKSVTLQNEHGETKKVLNTHTYTFKHLPADTVNPAEFTLEHYNLTPPTDDVYEDRPDFNWPLWGGIGAGCVALSVFLALLIGRKRKTARG